jgi:hypothetical protein
MSDLRKAHEQEAMELALELYNLESRRGEVKQRLAHIAVILQTAGHYEAAAAPAPAEEATAPMTAGDTIPPLDGEPGDE